MTFTALPKASAALAVCGLLSGCVAATHQEDAAVRAARPNGQTALVAKPAGVAAAFPSLTGDILAGMSPDDLARARARQSEALTRALGQP